MNNFKNKRILVVVAHPDDELLGIGGTLKSLSNSQNCKIKVVILGEGLTSRSDKREAADWEEKLKHHRKNIYNAKDIIGYHQVSIYNFPDNRFDSINLLDIIKVVEKEKTSFNPDIVFTHHGGDLNIDHQRVFEAVITATRPLEDEITNTIITFETPSGTEWRASSDPKHFIPNMFFKLSEENIQAKINAMECYEFEKRTYPHPRSPEALRITAQQRGITVGCKYAEAFCIIRSIIEL